MSGLENLTLEDINVIKYSLECSKNEIENYQGYERYEQKREKMLELERVLRKIQEIAKTKI